jgi:nucleotide-binding universal stress UspA family protein
MNGASQSGSTGIVVGVDGSEGAAHALRWAVREAGLRGRPVTALLAWGYLDQHWAAPDHVFDPAYGEADALAALDEAVARALDVEAAAGVTRRAVCDLAARALLDASAGADMLVVGARGLGGFRGLLLGSVSQQCLNHARRPLAIVRHGDDAAEIHAHAGPERIVVGVDGSKPANRALRWAVDEARLRGGVLELVHAWRVPVSVVGVAPGATVGVDPFGLETNAAAVLDEATDAVDQTGLAWPVERTLSNRGAAWAILESARQADLVVVGSRGRGGFAGLVLGSVSHQVTHHAPCPVVVIPPGADLDRDDP